MGAIYLAKQPLLDRTVVVKVILTECNQDASLVQRFKQEAQALAALEHPHIVSLYEYGYEHEIAYFVMPYISGGTLGERLKQGPLSLTEVVHLYEQIGAALDFAHQRSIIHRDIKPANVLLRDGSWPLLADFGVAKLLCNTTQTTGGPVGTPLYMAPEQWLGQHSSGQTDIYALGVMLYELLTGAPPFKGNDWGSIMRQHLQDAPSSICVHNPTVPRALEQVIFRAMAKEPAQRFSTAKELAIAARQAIEGQDVRPEQPVPGILPSPIFQGMPSHWRPDPFVIPPTLDLRFTPPPRTFSDNTEAQSTISPTAADEEAETAPGMSAYATLRVNQYTAPRRLLDIPVMTTEWKNLPGTMDTIAFSAEANKVISSTLNTILLWEVGTAHPVAQLQGHTRAIWALAVTTDGQFLASGSWDQSIRLWELAHNRLKRTLIGHSDIILALTLAMNDRMLVSASRDGTLRYWEMPNGRQVRSIRHPGGAIWSVLGLPSGDMVAAGAENGMVGLWSVKSGQTIWTVSLGDVGPVHRLLMLGSRQLLCITQKGALALIDASTGAIQQVSTLPTATLYNAVILDTELIYTDTSGTLYRRNMASSQQLTAIRAHSRRIPAMAVEPTVGIVATGSEDRSIRLWRFL